MREGGIGRGELLGATALAYLGWKAWRSLTERPLRGRVVLITGGSRGLGFLLAQEFAREGCRLVICARDVRQLEVARSQLAADGADVLALPCDISDRAQADGLVAAATSHFGRIDILVNNAGVIRTGPLDTMRLADFEHALANNFWGAAHMTLAVLPQMRRRRGGSIVNITSIGGKVAIPHLLPDDCAKFALVGFSEGLHSELARFGIRVTTIVPGLMRTGSPANAQFKGRQAAEFTWFSLASATPLTTMSARRAARRVVKATRRGEAHVTLTWQASALRALHGVAPGATARLLGVANRLLPNGDGSDGTAVRGMQLATALAPSPITVLMNGAARRTNQYTGKPRPSPRHARRVGLP